MARGDGNNDGGSTSTKHHAAAPHQLGESSSMTHVLDSQCRNPNFSKKCLAWLLLVAIVAAAYIVWNSKYSFVVKKDGTIISTTKTPHYYIQTHDKFTTTHHQTSNETLCNCLGPAQKEHCCQRTIYRLHKMGTILLGDLFQHFRHDVYHQIRTKHVPWRNTKFATDKDYRHVLVTRNWLDAIVSGYLYHKAGYECSIDYRGKDREVNRTDDWDAHLEYHTLHDIPYPPRNNRSLCTYLQQESQEDGIKVIIDIALSWWYQGVIPYSHQVQQEQLKHHDDDEHKSLFVCFEDLVNPRKQEGVFHDMLEHFFPDQNTSGMHMPPKMKALLLQQQQNHNSVYQGGHASTHDASLRATLRDLVVRFDRELFNNTVATSNAVFHCG